MGRKRKGGAERAADPANAPEKTTEQAAAEQAAAEQANAPEETIEQAAAEQKRASGYYVKQGKAVTALASRVKSDGDPITARDVSGGEATIKDLVRRGVVEQVK